MTFEPTVQQRLNKWLTGNYDIETRTALINMLDQEQWEEITDSFYKELEFGTGGLRGIMGPGSNRVNKYTIGAATQGLSNYLNDQYPNESISVVVAHDSRIDSDTFARITSEVFAANGIKVFLFDSMRPTPELSFAIRELGAKGGVMLTASHNPKEYNGYKAYGPNGGQLVAPHDKNVISEVRKISGVDDIKFDHNANLIEIIGAEIDNKYLNTLVELTLDAQAIDRQKDMKIVFSPIHGTGAVSVPQILKKKGFTNIILVEKQMTGDGNFPTVVYPNPEEHEALSMAIDKAQSVHADLVMATDPDADRVGIAVKGPNDNFVLLNGNQTAALLVEYMLDTWHKFGKLDGNQYIVKTIVTSFLLNKIAKNYSVDCYDTLTGFKWIGELMTKLEGHKTFVVGGEESYGYLIGEHARDKDAVVSCAMIAEMAAHYKDKGKTLYEALLQLHKKYGLYHEKLVAIAKKGKKGAKEIQTIMTKLRSTPPRHLGGSAITMIKDFQSSLSKDMSSDKVTPINLPKSNVLQFITADGSVISARPSGTEPKIKFYCSVYYDLSEHDDYEQVKTTLESKIDTIMNDIVS